MAEWCRQVEEHSGVEGEFSELTLHGTIMTVAEYQTMLDAQAASNEVGDGGGEAGAEATAA